MALAVPYVPENRKQVQATAGSTSSGHLGRPFPAALRLIGLGLGIFSSRVLPVSKLQNAILEHGAEHDQDAGRLWFVCSSSHQASISPFINQEWRSIESPLMDFKVSKRRSEHGQINRRKDNRESKTCTTNTHVEAPTSI